MTNENEKVITNAIQEWIDKVSKSEHKSKTEIAYYKWAAKEILNYILTHDSMTPVQAVLDFHDMMAKYVSLNKENGNIFLIAFNASSLVYGMLLNLGFDDYEGGRVWL